MHTINSSADTVRQWRTGILFDNQLQKLSTLGLKIWDVHIQTITKMSQSLLNCLFRTANIRSP